MYTLSFVVFAVFQKNTTTNGMLIDFRLQAKNAPPWIGGAFLYFKL